MRAIWTAAILLLALNLPRIYAEETKSITWDDLLPKEELEFDDPFEELSEEQLLDLGLIARIRFLLESEKIEPDGVDAQEEKEMVARLTEQGIDVDWILSQRERVAEMRQKRAEAVDEGVNGKLIRIPGYMLPLKSGETGVTEFLLVPWVGACIHTPPPPPNQMIHVDVPDGTENKGRFAAIWLEGKIELKPGSYDLFLVDGTRSINVAYTMTTDTITEYSSASSDVLAQVSVPETANNPEGHSTWQSITAWYHRQQTWASIQLTKGMTDIQSGKGSGALLFALLLAFGYGIIHTLGPGHGKVVVASYFVGEGGSLKRGVSMGTQIAIFHVLSAIIVVSVVHFILKSTTGDMPSNKVVKMVSYSAIAVIGGFMLWRAIQTARLKHDHSHSHTHGHDHDDDHRHEGDVAAHELEGGDKHDAEHHHTHAGCVACEAVAKRKKGISGWLALAVGAVPCTGALLVLLFGMANDLLLPAIYMVIAISIGMAMTLSIIGVLAILGRQFAERRFEGNESRSRAFANGARIFGAACVVLIGLFLISVTLSEIR